MSSPVQIVPVLFQQGMGPVRLAVMTLLCLWGSGFSEPARATEKLEYNRDIRPILAEYCFSCHGADSASRKADLRLDEREAAIEFGAIIPGKPEQSELISRVFSDDHDLVMPPLEIKKQLSAAEKEKLKLWIAAGAEYQPHWSFLAPQLPPLPEVQNQAWVKNEIDRFVLARLEAAGLTPAAEVDAGTLFRRLHLDITGLPPSPENLRQFVTEYQRDSEQTLSQWIDRLMQTPAWGEHRARYWLDAARYADTHGLHFDNYREMWPYRDWVIRSFNANQPFKQFVVEQLAGDLLPTPTDDQLIATGFQRCNITTNEGGTIDDENVALYATDRVQTFGWVFLGLTTNCAQCHDHKFDPISMKDYYALAAYFRNTTQKPKDGNVKDGLGPVMVVPSDTDRERWKNLPEEINLAQAARKQRQETARDAFSQWLATASPELLDNRIPAEGLITHLLLNGGAETAICNEITPEEVFATPEGLTWANEGKLGPAPVFQAGTTLDLGSQGDFEKDQSFSFGAWIKLEKDSQSAAILARMDEQKEHRGWDLWQQGKNIATHLIDSWPNNALKVTTRDNPLKAGTWHHVLVTYDGSAKPAGVKIYVDGQERATRIEANALKKEASIRTETPLRVGQRSQGSVFQGGQVQDVRIYQRTLEAREAQNLFNLLPLRNVIAKTAEERTAQETAQLYDYYLHNYDAEYPGLHKKVTQLETEKQQIQDRSPVTHIQQERMDTPAMTHILLRGEYDQLGEVVHAAPLQALHPLPEGAAANRLGLAEWVIDPANPLTTRVTVNRFWQEIFGQGLVITSEDFGIMGTLPSHPELLDWLALQFEAEQGDVKRFFKRMLMSATYRQSAEITPVKLEKDRDNTLMSRGPRFRMDAEMIRDYALASSGLLSSRMYGPGVKPYQPENLWDIVGLPGGNTRNYVQDKGENLYRRSLYSFWKRMAPPPNLEGLNAPNREVCTVRRERTNTPLQALITLNDPQFLEAARVLAELGLKQHGADQQALLGFLAERIVCRSLTADEQKILAAFHQEFLKHYQAHPEDAAQLLTAGEKASDPELAPAELAAWTIIANQLLNLDETLNK